MALNFNFQGSNSLLGDLNMVETYRRLGVGHMLLAYNHQTMAGEGCHEQNGSGLSQFGERLVREMNRVGMIVDASHTGYRTTMDLFEVSSSPVIFSHSNANALVDHERNIRDDQIKACAKTGGVIGINGLSLFLSESGIDFSSETIANHIDYMAQLVGAQHVGFGLDYVGGNSHQPTTEEIERNMAFFKANTQNYPESGRYAKAPLNFAQPGVISEVTEALVRKGYGDADIRGILGENFMRVCSEVWKV